MAILVLWAAFSWFLTVIHGLETESLGTNGSVSSSTTGETNHPYRTEYHFQPTENWMNFGLGTEGLDKNVSASSFTSSATKQPYRTAYHFQPPKNWMNDLNAYYKGVYHLFYQYNPYSATWANMTWGHVISYDLVNWVHLEYALIPSEPHDLGGVYSGSITFLPGGKPVILYMGAYSKYSHNPVISANDGDINPTSFRDPTTAWQGPDDVWRVLIGGQIDGRGMAFLYESKDFVNWTRNENPFHSSAKTGNWECPDFYHVNISGKNGMENYLEENHTKFVLMASFFNHDHNVMGNYNAKTNQFDVETTDFMEGNTDLRYDCGGKFYASKAFFDSGERRRILWAWVPESDTRAGDIEKGWSGLMSFRRVLWLSTSGKQLVQWPVHEIETLRKEKVEIKGIELKSGSIIEVKGITASQADVEASFELPNFDEAELMEPGRDDPQLLCSQKNAGVIGAFGPFGLLVLASTSMTEQTAIFFRVFKNHNGFVVLMCSDLSRSSLRKDVDKTSFGAFIDINPLQEKITLRTLIDHSIIESSDGEGKACITSRVYPVLAVDKEAELYAFKN